MLWLSCAGLVLCFIIFNLLGCRPSTGRNDRLERPWEAKLGSPRTLLLRLDPPKKLKHWLIPLKHPLTLPECAWQHGSTVSLGCCRQC